MLQRIEDSPLALGATQNVQQKPGGVVTESSEGVIMRGPVGIAIRGNEFFRLGRAGLL